MNLHAFYAFFLSLALTVTRAAWTFNSGGTTGVGAMQLAVLNSQTVIIIDKLEKNPLHDSSDRPVWAAVYTIASQALRPLKLITNSFCATGSWLSNGTRVRHFNPCTSSGTCNFFENPQRVRLASQRWYPSSVRLSDGSVLVFGGAHGGDWTNNPSLNNPTYEYYPAKNIAGRNGLPISSLFLVDSLPHNMFPHIMLLPSNSLFVAANNRTMFLDWKNNIETRLPNLPNGQRVTYPMSGAGVLLPLTPENNYTPEVLLCGGSQVSDTVQSNQISSQTPASSQCSRMKLTSAGVAAGWATESMPQARVMPDATLLPDGTVLIVNGAQTGTAGYGNVQNQVGQSNADNPAFTPVLYNPSAPAGSRFSSSGMPTSNIARMYHSVSTLLPNGAVLIAGSNPNADVSTTKYATEYRIEILNPSYMTVSRPTFSGIATYLNYGGTMALSVSLPSTTSVVTASLMDLGFMTHGVHMDMRLVKLLCTLSSDRRTLTVTGPPNSTVYPPGPGWIYVLSDGIPSVGQRLMIGVTGQGPPVDQAAINNMLANTGSPAP
ncbi:glyoxal oxidase [Ceratobasidium sp. AG-Ba]|nr:glyoxal oxidase [Ceratobasidium sp. AG-Ba]